MIKKVKISRKRFFKIILRFLSIPITILVVKGIQSNIEVKQRIKIILPSDLPLGISFVDKVIVSKNENKLVVFSSSCSHLGCKISSEKDGKLICPCHGSNFDHQGKPLLGPAVKPLEKLDISIDKKTGELVVYV